MAKHRLDWMLTRLLSTKKQAIEELSAIGVTFPVGIDYYISGSNQAALDSANVLAQALSNSLGDDFVQLNIKTYVSSATKEVNEPKLQSINISGWNADYGDPLNYIGQETYGNDSAYYTRTLSNVNDRKKTRTTKLCWMPTRNSARWLSRQMPSTMIWMPVTKPLRKQKHI